MDSVFIKSIVIVDHSDDGGNDSCGRIAAF